MIVVYDINWFLSLRIRIRKRINANTSSTPFQCMCKEFNKKINLHIVIIIHKTQKTLDMDKLYSMCAIFGKSMSLFLFYFFGFRCNSDFIILILCIILFSILLHWWRLNLWWFFLLEDTDCSSFRFWFFFFCIFSVICSHVSFYFCCCCCCFSHSKKL